MKLGFFSDRWTGRPKIFLAVVLLLYLAGAIWVGWGLWWLAHHTT
jgi:hypothetical protein